MRTVMIVLPGVCAQPSLRRLRPLQVRPHQTTAPQKSAVLFEGARLIVGDASPPIESSAFIVEDGKIGRVGRKGEIAPPAGATRVDLTGKTVMPALVSTHVHVGLLSGMSFGPEIYTHDNIVDHLQRYAYYGLAAVLSPGTDVGPLAFQVRSEQPSGAARLLTAGRGMAAPDGGPGIPSIANTSFPITSAEEGRKRVQELAEQRADAVKIWVDDRNGRVKKLTPDIYGPIIDEAHKHGMMALAHVYYLKDAHQLVDAGHRRLHAPGPRRGDGRSADREDEAAERLHGREHRRIRTGPRCRRLPAAVARIAVRIRSAERRRRIPGDVCEGRPEGRRRDARHVRQDGAQPREAERRRRHHCAWRRHRHSRRVARMGRAVRARADGRRRDDPGAGDRRVDERRRAHPEARRPGHGRDWQERRLPRPRCQPARRHHQHAANLGGLSQGSGARSSCAPRAVDDRRYRRHGTTQATVRRPFERRSLRWIRTGRSRFRRSRDPTVTCTAGPPAKSAAPASTRTTTSSRSIAAGRTARSASCTSSRRCRACPRLRSWRTTRTETS